MTVALGTYGGGTHWPHMKKFAPAGTRRIAIWNGGSGAKVSWTTTFGTWTDYAADIPGWLEGSLATYQESDGTWRAVTHWLQQGAGGGRTDRALYVMVGTFSTDLATLTWGTALLVATPPSGGAIGLPVLDAVADGTGGLALTAWAVVTSSGSRSSAVRRLTISATGIPTLDSTATTVNGPWASSPYPAAIAIAIDPVTKHVGVLSTAGNAGAAGSGLGLWFRKGIYNSGAWSWPLAVRSIDETVTLANAGSELFGMQCEWDPADQAWILGGHHLFHTSTGRTRFFQRDLADTTTTPLFDDETPVNQLSGPWGVDPASGNVLAFGSHPAALGGTTEALQLRTLARAGDHLVDAGYITLDSATDLWTATVYVEAGAAHLVYLEGTPAPTAVDYLRVPLPQAPTAPTGLAPSGGVFVNVAQPQTFSWAFQSPDSGDSQTAAQLYYRPLGAPTWTATGWMTPLAATHTVIAGSTFTSGVDYEWQVEVKGSTGLVSPRSSSGFFSGIGAPTDVAVTNPPNAGTVGATFVLAWSVSDEDSYQVRIVADAAGLPDDATVLDGTDSGEVFDPAARSATMTSPASGLVVHPEVRVRVDGIWSDWASVRVLTSYSPPGLPTVTLLVGDGYVDVITHNEAGDPDPLLPPTSGTPILLVDAGGPGGTF